MPQCNCKLCREGHRERIDSLPSEGMSKEEIQEWIKDNLKFRISLSTLTKHFESCDIKVIDYKPVQVEPIEAIDLRKELDDCDITNWIDEPSSYLIIEKLQKIHLHIHFLQAVRAKVSLEKYLRGESRVLHPSIMKDLEISFNILNKLCGIEVLVNREKAIKLRENLGIEDEPEINNSFES
jgi:hypothetical protein